MSRIRELNRGLSPIVLLKLINNRGLSPIVFIVYKYYRNNRGQTDPNYSSPNFRCSVTQQIFHVATTISLHVLL